MIARESIVAAARAWLGTPFAHQGRLRGVGVDCVGLVVGAARAVGMVVHDVTDYGRQPVPGQLVPQLDAQLERIPAAEARAGDVLLLRIARDPQHVAIISSDTPPRIIHAHAQVGRCVEHALDDKWRRRILAAYRIPGAA